MYRVKITNKKNYTFKVEAEDYEFDIGPKGKGIAPPAVLLASLGSCIGVYIEKYAEGAKLDLGEFSVEVEAEFSREKPVCFKNINVSVGLDNTKIDDRRKQSLLAFIKNCPIHNTLNVAPEIVIEIT